MQRSVVFLYLEPHRYRGAVLMRCHQLAEICTAHLGDAYDFTVRALPARKDGDQRAAVADIRDAVVILSKSAIAHITRPCFDLLKRNNVAICADWIDRNLRAPILPEIDLHIAASHAFAAHARRALPEAPVMHVTHHADLRLHGLRFPSAQRLAPLYLGHPDNLADIPDLQGWATVVTAKRDSQFSAFLPRLPEFNLHLNIRPAMQVGAEIIKPLTKAFTAALCRSNLIVQRDVHDVESYLGPDYPYLLADSRPETVRDMMRFVRESFGGPIWQRGLDQMAEVADRSSPRHIASEMQAVLTTITGGTRAPALGRAA